MNIKVAISGPGIFSRYINRERRAELLGKALSNKENQQEIKIQKLNPKQHYKTE